MPVLRLFAAAREAAGVARADIDGATVGEMLDQARARFGERFVTVLDRSRIWVNGQPASGDTPVEGRDVVAVIPPVSGGAGDRIGSRGSGTAVLERERRAADRPRAEPVASRPTPPPSPPVASPGRSGGQRVATDAGPGGPVRAGASAAEVRPIDLYPPSPRRPLPVDRPDPTEGLRQRRPGGNGARPTVAPDLSPAGKPRPAGPSRPGSSGPGALGGGVRAPERPGPSGPVRAGDAGPAVLPPSSPPASRPPTDRAVAADRSSTQPPPPPVPVFDTGRSAPEFTEPDRATPTGESGSERKPVMEVVTPTASKLAVQFDTARPHGRLGVLWLLILIPAAILGSEWLAVVLGTTAVVSACQAVGARRSRGQHPALLPAALTAFALPLAAMSGLEAVAIAAAGAAGLIVVVWVFFPRHTSPGDIIATLGIGGLLGLAAASPVLLRDFRMDLTLLLLAFACFYDAGAYLVGTGASYAWEGPAAGAVALIPVTIFAGVVLVPPLTGGEPFLLGLLAAALVPLGPLLGTALIGTPAADVPGLRRLDSLLILGPVWAAVAAAMV